MSDEGVIPTKQAWKGVQEMWSAFESQFTGGNKDDSRRWRLPKPAIFATCSSGSGRIYAAAEVRMDASGNFATFSGARTWSDLIVPGARPKAGDLLKIEPILTATGYKWVGFAQHEILLDNMTTPAAATKLFRRRHTATSYVDDTLDTYTDDCP